MKLKIALILSLSFLLVACGQSEEDKKKAEDAAKVEQLKAQAIAMQIETNQRNSVVEALTAITKIKPSIAEYFSNNNECSTDMSKYPPLEQFKTLKSVKVTKDCEIIAEFLDSAYLPDLSNEKIIVRMSVIPGAFVYDCKFTGSNKKDIPDSCK